MIMDIFTESTIRGKLGINALESAKSLYDIVVVDSLGIEKNFAEALEKRMQWKYIPTATWILYQYTYGTL